MFGCSKFSLSYKILKSHLKLQPVVNLNYKVVEQTANRPPQKSPSATHVHSRGGSPVTDTGKIWLLTFKALIFFVFRRKLIPEPVGPIHFTISKNATYQSLMNNDNSRL